MSSSVQILALNSSEDGFERCKLNAAKALTVDGSSVTQPVSGSVAVSAVSGTVAVDASGSTVPVSLAGSVAVTGAFYPADQPVSVAGSVAVTGAFYPADQPVSIASAVAVTGAFYQATQPVSGSVSISGNVATVSGATSVSNSSQFSSESIAAGASAQSAGLDISAVGSCLLYGDTDNTSDEIDVEISFDNSNWYNLGLSLYPDPDAGNFAREIESSAKYIRLNKSNTSGVAESITASIMTKA